MENLNITFDKIIESGGKCDGNWGDLPQQMPDIQDDMNQLDKERFDWETHVSKQLNESSDWKEGCIGNVSQKDIFYDGLSPMDFMRAFHDRHKDLEVIDGLLDIDGGDPFFAKMGLHQDHINNNFTDEELDNCCYERPGSLRWYAGRIAAKMDCDIQEIPLVVLQCIQQVNIEKSLGRQNFRNYMRNVKKKHRKLKNKQNLDDEGNFKKYKSTNKKPEYPLLLTGKCNKKGQLILTWD